MPLLHTASHMVHTLLSIGLGLLGITFVVGFHELGHFLFCKLFGIRTPTFSVGFGPVLAQKKAHGTNFVLSAIPLGGFVEIAGMAEVGQGDQKEAKATDAGSFNQRPFYQKLLVMMGGIIFNLAFAYSALIMLFFLGLPKTKMLYPYNAKPVIETIAPDSPAAESLHVGDTITAINSTPLHDNAFTAFSIIAENPEKEITLTVTRTIDGALQELTIPVIPRSISSQGTTVGQLGVTFQAFSKPGISLFEAIKQGTALANKMTLGTLQSIKNIFAKRDVSNLGGPIMVISQTVKSASESFGVYILMLALISISLAVFNLLPLPILDGGQIAYYTIEALAGRPLSAKVREYIHIASWVLILGLMLYLSAQDLYKIVKPFLSKFI